MLIAKYDLITQFKQKKIGLIVNVQRPGEHPYCGPNKGLDIPSGFTYSPSLFTSEGIEVKLSGWKDMNVPESLSFMLDIVKDMAKVIKKKHKRVLVHCHAGFGRTGIVIASYKMFSEHITAEQAVKELRAIRRQCVQSRSQMKYCQTFHEYLMRLRKIFNTEKTPISLYLKNQNDLDIGDNVDIPYNKYVPLMIIHTLNHILDLYRKGLTDNLTIIKALNGTIEIKSDIEHYFTPIIENINNGNWDVLQRYDDIGLMVELLYKWLTESVYCCIDQLNINQLFSLEEFKAAEHDDEIKLELLEYNLSKYQIEIIKYFSDFFSEICRENEEFDGEICIMKEKIALALFGLTIEEASKSQNISLNVQRLISLFDFYSKYTKILIESSNKSENEILFDENGKEKALHDVFLVLSNYFEKGNNNTNNQLKLSQSTIRSNLSLSSHNKLVNNINNLVKSMKKPPPQESVNSKENNLYKSEQFKLPKISTIVQNNLPKNNCNKSSYYKVRTTFSLNISKNQNLKMSNFQSKNSLLPEPWIKEEDC